MFAPDMASFIVIARPMPGILLSPMLSISRIFGGFGDDAGRRLAYLVHRP